MWRELFSGHHDWLMDLPIVSMGIFIFVFVAVLVRVSKKSRAPEYRRMASLPLEDDARRD